MGNADPNGLEWVGFAFCLRRKDFYIARGWMLTREMSGVGQKQFYSSMALKWPHFICNFHKDGSTSLQELPAELAFLLWFCESACFMG